MSVLLSGCVGACLGSFGYAMYLRKSKAPGHEEMQSALTPSHCPVCHTKLHWSDNIPIVSYLVLRGHCRHCEAEIPIEYFMAEVAGAVVSVVLGSMF